MRQMFSVRTSDNIKKLQQQPVILGREITWFSWSHHFQKARFWNVLCPYENEKPQRFQIPSVWREFSKKLCFRDGLVHVDGRSNRTNKAARGFQIPLAWYG